MKITELLKKVAFLAIMVGSLALVGCGKEEKAPEKKTDAPAPVETPAPKKAAPAPAKAASAPAKAPEKKPAAPAKPQ